jgi:glycosyltransferase involved in cell wall biosynthesis
VVVDDGSADATGAVLERWRRDNPDAALLIERHARNRGKGRALRTGFEAAARAGATHAVSVDSDGQHDGADVGPLLAIARAHPTALLLGVRSRRIAGCPGRCALGRRVANTLVRAETRLRLRDTQCGLRVYPLGLVRSIPCRAGRFGYETEIVVRAAWAGCPIMEAPVSCVYEVPGGRVSHWRPVVDTVRDGLLHARLIARSLVPVPHRRWPEEDDELGGVRGAGRPSEVAEADHRAA